MPATTPEWCDPQHVINPPVCRAQASSSPTLIAVAVLTPSTDTGVEALRLVSSPNCPESLEPQHLAVPSDSAAHVELPPALMAVTWRRSLTGTGSEVL